MPVEPITDPSITIKPSAKLIDFVLKKVTDTSNAPEGIVSLRTSKKDQRSSVLLKVKDVKWLNAYLEKYRKNSEENVYIHELLEDADVLLPEPTITPRNPELEARIQRLTARQNAREYEAMTKSVDPVRKRLPEDTIAYQMKEINRQLIAVAQFVFSVIAGFTFGFLGVELIVGNLDFGFRLLLGIICGLVVALAEIYFLAKKLNENMYDDFIAMPTYKKMHQE
ncbi:transmembrane protein 199 [Orussus abietinus]|uniref:transmembrane protein 199 n=1 Tax=Orussus abietinus TaxID=222816 RepID=UPI00062516A5|nr:transmembrane protein 199 [Orussus abietinus]